ncbi:MAG: hypothetical protein AB7Q97_09925 [Gammaproteobacteria bacterium]
MPENATAHLLKPSPLQQWLDDLPMTDFVRSAAMMERALQHSYHETLKPGMRLNLTALYWRPYRMLLDTLVGSESQPTLRSVDVLQARVEALRRVALELARGTRLGITEAAPAKALFGNPITAPEATVWAARLTSHALMLNFQGYGPPLSPAWRELNDLFLYAERGGSVDERHADPEDPGLGADSVRGIYMETAAVAVTDPLHLPPGAVWEIYAQIRDWVDEIRIGPWHAARNPAGLFVVDLLGSSPPVPYARFDAGMARDHHRVLDCTGLQRRVQAVREQLGTPGAAPLRLPRPQARLLLEILRRAWGLHPKRYFPRHERDGSASLAFGFNEAWQLANHGRDIVLESRTGVIVGGEEVHEPRHAPAADPWQYVDEGPGGYAVYSATRPRAGVRVGELVAIRDADSDRPWMVGAVRWLMVHDNLAHRIGVQIVGRDVESITLRATDGSDEDMQPQRAFLVADPSATNGFTVMTRAGLYAPGRPLELHVGGTRMRVTAATLRESALTFDYFSCRN